MKKIALIDTLNSTVHVFTYNPNVWNDAEEFLFDNEELEHLKISPSNCQWMEVGTDENINIEIH